MTWDMERLISSLAEIALDHEVVVDEGDIREEVQSIAKFVNERKDQGKKPSMQELLEICFASAGRLEIPVPDGLLMLAKSLVTIEGLAKGIDPQISMARIASPVLFKAARPDFKDLLSMGKKLPKIAGQFLHKT